MDANANTDPTGTQTSWFSNAVGNVASWFTGQPTAAQLQATSASLDNQLKNGTNAQTLAATIAGNAPSTVTGPTTGPDTFSGDANYYAPGGAGYQEILDTQGQPAADAAYAQVLGDISQQEAQTAAIPSQIGDAAIAGAENGLANAVNTAKNPFGDLFKVVGWQWLLIGGLVLFFYLGGMDYLRRQLKKA